MTLARFGLIVATVIAVAVAADYAALLAGATRGDIAALASDRYLHRVVAFTFLQATLSAILSLAAAIPAARALARQAAFPGRTLILHFCALPMVMPSIVAIFGVVAVYGRSGYLAEIAAAAGSDWRPSIYGLTGILIAHVFFNLPLAIRFLLPAWAAVPSESWRLAAQLGMSARQVFRLIELPLLRQYVPAAFAFVFILCFLSFAVILSLGGGPRATTLEVAIYQALRLDVDLPRGGALALLQSVVCLGLVVIAWALSPGLDLGRGLRLAGRRFDGATTGARAIDFALIAVAIGFVALPLAALLFDGLRGLFFAQTDAMMLAKATLVTLALGIPSGLIATVLGFSIAVAADRRRKGRLAHAVLNLAGLAGIVASPMAVGAGITLALAGRVDLYAIAPFGVVSMNALLTLPFAVGVLRPAVARAHAQYDRLCAGLGIDGCNRFRVVDWPLLRRAIGLACGLTSAVAMGDLAAIALFGNQNLTNLTLLLYNQISAYRLEAASGTALVLLVLCLATFALIERGVGGRSGRLAFLEIEGLAFNYEDMHMRFDLAVEAGECVGVIGPSGAGKSTLLALIGGFEASVAGTIRVDGADITALPPAERPVTSLFQDFNLFPHLSVADNVGLGRNPGLRLTATDRGQVAWALNEVGLSGFEARLPGQLSGGERQRVALARSLIRHRPLLLLDEPFAALGPALRTEMLELTDRLRRVQGMTVLLVTHDPNEAARIAERTAFVADGAVVLFDRTDAVLRSELPQVRDYLGS